MTWWGGEDSSSEGQISRECENRYEISRKRHLHGLTGTLKVHTNIGHCEIRVRINRARCGGELETSA